MQPVRPTRHRRTVRIVKPRTVQRAALVSLGIAAAVALVFIIAWRLWYGTEPIQVYERTIRDVEVEWRCEGGHAFESVGQLEPRPCWMCGQPAFPSTAFRCPVHGTYDVAFRFAVDEFGVPQPKLVRVATGDWATPEEGLKCPRCRRDLIREPQDPLDRAVRRMPRP